MPAANTTRKTNTVSSLRFFIHGLTDGISKLLKEQLITMARNSKNTPFTLFKLWLIKAIDTSSAYRLMRPDLFFAYTNCLRNITALELNEEGIFLGEEKKE